MDKYIVLLGLVFISVLPLACGTQNNPVSASTPVTIVITATNPPTATNTPTNLYSATPTTTPTVTLSVTPTPTPTGTSTPTSAYITWFYNGDISNSYPVTYSVTATDANGSSVWSNTWPGTTGCTYNGVSEVCDSSSTGFFSSVIPGISTYSASITNTGCEGVSIAVVEQVYGAGAQTIKSAIGSCATTITGTF